MFTAPTWWRGANRIRTFSCYAASKLGVSPAGCLVIEDSASGIRAAVAAGMTAVGLCAASHIRDGHDLRLRDAGAVHLAQSWPDVERIALQFFGS